MLWVLFNCGFCHNIQVIWKYMNTWSENIINFYFVQSKWINFKNKMKKGTKYDAHNKNVIIFHPYYTVYWIFVIYFALYTMPSVRGALWMEWQDSRIQRPPVNPPKWEKMQNQYLTAAYLIPNNNNQNRETWWWWVMMGFVFSYIIHSPGRIVFIRRI